MVWLYVTGILFIISVIFYWKVSSPLGSLPTYEDLKAAEQVKEELEKQST
jgi:hypothetical protein